jgi:hypothetical protein
MNLEGVFNRYQSKLGKAGGEQVDVYRPDYASEDQSGDGLIFGRKLRLQAQANKLSEPAVSGALQYNCYGQRDGIEAGDILVPITSGTGTPVITVASKAPQKAMIGFMTDRVGKITEDLSTDVYTNIRFAWLPITFPGSSLTEEMAGSMAISTRKAVLYKREGIKRGMRLIDETDEDDQRWEIKDFIVLNNMMVLNLNLDKK